MRKSVLIIVIIIVILLIGGGAIALNYNSNSNSPTPQANNSTQNQTTATNTVNIRDMMFTPSQITVNKGDTVTWTNNDNTAHTIIADQGNGPASGNVQPGSTYSYIFNKSGSYQYHCNIHSAMHGTIVVR